MENAAAVVIEGATIIEAFRANVRTIPTRPAMRRRAVGGWETLTWADYGRAAAQVTAGLADLGIGAGERIAILSGNRVEWHLADIGALANGGVTVPIYPTSSAEQVRYILDHCGARLCFVEDEELLAKVLEVRHELPKLDRVVIFDDGKRLDDPFLVGFPGLLAVGADRLHREPTLVEERASAIAPEQPATFVYTSGTTGPPKAAVLSHANIMWTIRSAASLVHLASGERFLSFLPLSHVAERGMSEFAPIAARGETWFARSLATVAEDLLDCRPTVFFAVPRVWEKLQSAVLAKIEHAPWLAQQMVHRYVELALLLEAQRATRGRGVPWETVPHAVLDAALGTMIRREIGLDRAHILITAAAPIHPDLLRWLHAIGLPVIELYGQTEVCGPTTCNPPEDNRVGTVGRALPGVEVRIAEDGEILVRGGNVCAGYFNDPTSTAALLDADGWMHSGDLGSLDSDGYLRLTGRKKDLIITAAGQNIAPQDIEMELKSHPLVSEAVVVGEGRRYLTALLTLDAEALGEWAHDRGKVADFEALASDPDLREEVDAMVAVVNARRSRVEGIRKHRILAHELTVAAGELTPTLKVKRSVVCELNVDLIEDMYAEDV
ncbi:MAG: long-chain fatty acid--CoA ligase [Acidimicrobiales bacterium]